MFCLCQSVPSWNRGSQSVPDQFHKKSSAASATTLSAKYLPDRPNQVEPACRRTKSLTWQYGSNQFSPPRQNKNRRTEERWLLNKLWTNFLKFWEMLTYMCKLTKISEGLCRVSKISVGLYIRTNLLGGQTFAKIHNKCQRRQSTMWPNCWLRQHNKVFWIFF